MELVIFLVVYAVVSLLLTYLSARFSWKFLDSDGFAWYWPFIVVFSPIIFCVWATMKLEELGKQHETDYKHRRRVAGGKE
jgi:fatty acid desaturase